MRACIFILVAWSLTACGRSDDKSEDSSPDGWSSDFRDSELQGCYEVAKADAQQKQALAYCGCIVSKAEKRWPDQADYHAHEYDDFQELKADGTVEACNQEARQ